MVFVRAHDRTGTKNMRNLSRYTIVKGMVIVLSFILIFNSIDQTILDPNTYKRISHQLEKVPQNMQVSLTSNDERRAELLLSIVQDRQDNLNQLYGTAYEPQAAKDLEVAVERAANAILELEGQQKEVYKAQLSTFILEIKSTLVYQRLQKPFQQVLTRLAQELVDADTDLSESDLEETTTSVSPVQSLKISSFQPMLVDPSKYMG